MARAPRHGVRDEAAVMMKLKRGNPVRDAGVFLVATYDLIEDIAARPVGACGRCKDLHFHIPSGPSDEPIRGCRGPRHPDPEGTECSSDSQTVLAR
jgi:hypothetical protein